MKFTIIHILFICSLILLHHTDVFAEEKAIELNKRIGVGPIDCQNCSKDVLDIVSKLRMDIHDKISTSLVLNVMPLEDMDKAVASVVREKDESLTAWALRIGNQAGLDKIVFAVITENEKKYVTDKTFRFNITIYAMDIKTGALDILQPVGTDNLEEIDQIFINAGDTVIRVYHGHSEITEKTEGSFTLSYLYPQADLRKGGAVNGFGSSFNVYLTEPAWILLTVGLFYFETQKSEIRLLSMVPFGIHIPFYCSITYDFKMIPSIGVGGLMSIMNFDEFRYRIPHEYHTELFFNPMITARLELNYFIINRYAIITTPSFSYVAGLEGRKGFIYSLDIGFKVQF